MFVYSMIMLVMAALFLGLGLAVYRGNTELIHDYHQTNVKAAERRAYGKAFATGLFAICAALLASGIVALLGRTIASLAVLALGLAIAMVILARAQKQYNGGIF